MTAAFWGPENAYLKVQSVSEWRFVKTILLSCQCKLKKCNFVKTLTSYISSLSLSELNKQQWRTRGLLMIPLCYIANWPGMHNKEFLGIFENVVVSMRKASKNTLFFVC